MQKKSLSKKKSPLEVSDSLKSLWELAVDARTQSHSPYSNFAVGAAFESGVQTFSGCNIENASYGATVCAERVALWKAVSDGVTRFDRLVVVAQGKKVVPPCALCLQVMAEFCPGSMLIHLADPEGIQKTYAFSELLPQPFGPAHL